MKIHTLPVSSEFRPAQQAYRYPNHNDTHDVEQDFFIYMGAHPELLVPTSEEADWSYLPVFWTRWHLQHDYAANGLVELQTEVKRVSTGRCVFTICQYDDGPIVDVGSTVVFFAARKTTAGRDIPALCRAHQVLQIAKRYRASFLGRLDTHPFRQEMARMLVHRDDIVILDGDRGEHAFVELLLASHIALCPRGYGGNSFRFYEAMQLGVVPLLVGEFDTRPFKQFIDWDCCSLYSPTAAGVGEIIDRFDVATLGEMGQRARDVYWNCLSYQKWCPYVFQELACELN